MIMEQLMREKLLTVKKENGRLYEGKRSILA